MSSDAKTVEHPPADGKSDIKTAVAIILILVVAAPIMFVNLGGRDFWAPDEPRFAQIGREMLRSGDWIVPRMNGKDVALLPPMAYWLIALPSAIHGDVTEFTARVLFAFMGLIGVLATFFLGKRMYGCRAGAFSAIILATSFKYLWQARWLQADMPLAAFVTLALLFFYCGLNAEQGKWLYYRLFYASMGLAVLSKGPLGVVLPGLAIIPYLTLTRSWRRIAEIYIPTGILLFLIVVAPWYVCAGVWGGKEFLREVVVKHNFGMFFDTWSHKEPVYFYLPHVFWLMMPWSLFIFPAIYHLVVCKENREQKVFLFSWLLVQFAFFTASDAKQEKYLLPIFPAAALIIGKGWADYIAGAMSDRVRKAMTAIAILTLGLLVLAGLAGPIVPAVLVRIGKYTPDIAKLVAVSLPLSSILVAAILPLAFILRKERGRAFATLVILCMALYIYGMDVAMNRFDAIKSVRPFCNKVETIAGAEGLLGIYGVNFRQTGAYIFYLNRPLDNPLRMFEDEKEKFVLGRLEEFFNSPGKAFCIVKDKYLPEIEQSPNMKVEVLLSDQVGDTQVYLISNGKDS